MTPGAFLRFLFGEDVPGHLVLWTRQDKKTCWIPANCLEAAGKLAERLATTRDVYFGVALQDKAAAWAQWKTQHPAASEEPTTRGYSETAKALLGLWIDVDVQGPAHKSVNLPPTKAAARARGNTWESATACAHRGLGMRPRDVVRLARHWANC